MARYRGLLIALGVLVALVLALAFVFLDYALTVKDHELVAVLAEGGTAIATFLLGGITVLAVLMPLIQREDERRDSADAAMRELYQIVTVFKTRTAKLAKMPTFNAEALLQGLDVLLARALADDIARALPRTTDTGYVYHSLFTAFDAISDAIHWQGSLPVERGNARDNAVAADVMLKGCLERLTAELKRRNAEWAPSQVGTWVGTTAGSNP